MGVSSNVSPPKPINSTPAKPGPKIKAKVVKLANHSAAMANGCGEEMAKPPSSGKSSRSPAISPVGAKTLAGLKQWVKPCGTCKACRSTDCGSCHFCVTKSLGILEPG